MHVYCVVPVTTTMLPEFFGTYKEARDGAKTFDATIPVVVELRDYPLEKDNVVVILNYMVADDDPAPKFTLLRKWKRTNRGGLLEERVRP